MKNIILLIISCLTTPLTFYSQNTWTGNGDGVSYTDANNWNDITVPPFGSEDIPLGLTINIPVGQTVQWSGGSLKGGGTINNLGTLQFNAGNKYIIDSSQLLNNGNIYHDDGVLYIQTGSVTNHSNYMIGADAKHIRFTAGTQHEFINHGTIVKTVGTGFNIIQATFTNDGTIRAETGELRLESTCVYTNGTMFETLANGTITFQSGNHTFSGLISGSSLGQILMKANINSLASTTFNISDNGTQCSTCSFNGGGHFIFENTLNFTAASLKYIYDSTTITVNDSTYLNQGSIYIQDGHLVNNDVLVIKGDNYNISYSSGSQHLFSNHGSIIKSSGSSVSFINTQFHNYGTLEVLSGELRMRFNGSYHDGTIINTAIGSIFSFHDGDHLFSDQISGHSNGQIIMKSHQFAHDQANFNISGTGLECSTCSFNGGGEFIMEDKFILSGNAIRYLNDSSTITCNDSMIFNGGSLYINTGQLNNNGFLEFTGDNQNITFSAGTKHDFVNAENAIVLKSAGTGNVRINANTTNDGSVYVASGKITFDERLTSNLRATYGGNGTIDVQSTYTSGVYNAQLTPGINGVGYLNFTGYCTSCDLLIDVDSLGTAGVNYDYVDFGGYSATLRAFDIELDNFIPPYNAEIYVASAAQFATAGLCPDHDCVSANLACSSQGFVDHRNYSELNNQYYHFVGRGLHQQPPFPDFAIVELFDITTDKLEVTKESNIGLPGEFVVITETAKAGDTVYFNPSVYNKTIDFSDLCDWRNMETAVNYRADLSNNISLPMYFGGLRFIHNNEDAITFNGFHFTTTATSSEIYFLRYLSNHEIYLSHSIIHTGANNNITFGEIDLIQYGTTLGPGVEVE